jgi:hypothetical protein
LLTLGRVICALKEISMEDDPKKAAAKAKATRIPYRDSKLTRVLQVGAAAGVFGLVVCVHGVEGGGGGCNETVVQVGLVLGEWV